jgi:hypothetical protein
MIYRGPGCFVVEWLVSSPTPTPLSWARCLSFLVFLCVAGRAYWRVRGGKGWGRSQIIRRRESLAFYKSFNTLVGSKKRLGFNGGHQCCGHSNRWILAIDPSVKGFLIDISIFPTTHSFLTDGNWSIVLYATDILYPWIINFSWINISLS